MMKWAANVHLHLICSHQLILTIVQIQQKKENLDPCLHFHEQTYILKRMGPNPVFKLSPKSQFLESQALSQKLSNIV